MATNKKTVRREIRDLTGDQWRRVVRAFWAMKRFTDHDGKTKYGSSFVSYDTLLKMHMSAALNPIGDHRTGPGLQVVIVDTFIITIFIIISPFIDTCIKTLCHPSPTLSHTLFSLLSSLPLSLYLSLSLLLSSPHSYDYMLPLPGSRMGTANP